MDFTLKWLAEQGVFLVTADQPFNQGFTEATFDYSVNGVSKSMEDFSAEIIDAYSFYFVPEGLQEDDLVYLKVSLDFDGSILSKSIETTLTYVVPATVIDEETVEEKPGVVYSAREKMFKLTRNSVVDQGDLTFDVYGEVFIPEMFPDMPEKYIDEASYTIPSGESSLAFLKAEEGLCYRFYLSYNGKLYIVDLKSQPVYYFSSYQSVLDDIDELGISVGQKSEQFIKDIIAEKSSYIKEQFGITQDVLSSRSVYPILKELTNLMTIKEMSALAFVTGDLEINVKDNGGEGYSSGKSFKLGNFSATDLSGNVSGTINKNVSSVSKTVIEFLNDMINTTSSNLRSAMSKYNVGTIRKIRNHVGTRFPNGGL